MLRKQRIYTKFRDDPLDHITRNLVKQLFKTQTLEDKIIASRTAILSKKLRGGIVTNKVQPIQQLKIYDYSKQNLQQSKPIQVQPEIISVLPETQTKINNDSVQQPQNTQFSQFKQTQLDSPQTSEMQQQFKNEQKTSISMGEIKAQTSSQSTLETQDQIICNELLQSNFSFQNSLQNSKCFFKKKRSFQLKQTQNLAEKVQNLQKQIEDLKLQISIIDQQKNKWKKKALKHSSKIKDIKEEQERFQKAYKQASKKE